MYFSQIMYVHQSTTLSGMSRSVLLSSDQTDSHVGIDMDSLRRQQQMQVIEQQVHYATLCSPVVRVAKLHYWSVAFEVSRKNISQIACALTQGDCTPFLLLTKCV